ECRTREHTDPTPAKSALSGERQYRPITYASHRKVGSRPNRTMPPPRAGLLRNLCYLEDVMSIPNVKRYRISSPDGSMTASLMAVLPKDIDVNEYLSDAAKRFDWKAYQELQQKQ